MYLTTEEARRKFPKAGIRDGAIIGERAYVGERATIGERAYVGEQATIGEGAYVREGAYIATVCSSYTGNIIPMEESMLIRIGCEIHDCETWKKAGAALARKHDEFKWWQDTGKNMLKFLLSEAASYERNTA